MREEYDFSNSVKNPYAKHVKNKFRFVLKLIPLIILKSLQKKQVSHTKTLSTLT